MYADARLNLRFGLTGHARSVICEQAAPAHRTAAHRTHLLQQRWSETMAELVAAVTPLLAADQAEPRYIEAVQAAVEKCVADTAGQTCYICRDGAADEGLVRGCACRGAAGVAHVSCLARQAQVAAERSGLCEQRWYICGLCEQRYHGVVACALGWACWKTYVGRPEADHLRKCAMTLLGNGLHYAGHHADALSVREAELSMLRRIGVPEEQMLAVRSNLANAYQMLGRTEQAMLMRRDVYSGLSKPESYGEEHVITLMAANNYASTLCSLKRFEEARSLLCRTMPVARRVLGENHEATLKMRSTYAEALCRDDSATLDDVREAVTTFEEIEPTARRVLGGANPLTTRIEQALRNARAELRASETPSPAHSGDCLISYF
jgi:hypothetical protein